MATPEDDLRTCTVRITRPDGNGTGFFVGPGLVLTCAHVVVGGVLDIVWAGHDPVSPGNIVHSGGDAAGTSTGYPYPDLALIEVALEGHPIAVLDDQQPALDEGLYLWGFPDNYPAGDSGTYLCEGSSGEPEPLLKLKEGEVRPGMSGAPLLRRLTGAVCGIVRKSRGKGTELGGRAVPIRIALATFPSLREDARMAPAVSPALKPAPSVPVPPALKPALPVPVNPIVGRAREIDEVCTKLSDHRLLTLTGAGGCGKTRLALAVAEKLSDGFSGELYFVDLTGAAGPDAVAPTVSTALGLPGSSDTPVLETLLVALRLRPVVLVLDNCERVVDECAALAVALLHGCPELRILATSTKLLRAEGECCYSVEPLPVPAPGELSARSVGESDAVRLFVQRAAAVSPSFTLTDENAELVGTLCRRLDGLPLALEMAAARLRLMSLRELVDGLAEELDVLTAGERTAVPHHRTLRATLDWSYRLLHADERKLLQRLGVFTGRPSFEAIAAVCGDGRPAHRVRDTLGVLVDASLVMVVPDGSLGNRYRLLETVRSYARERLARTGKDDAIRRAHLSFFLELAERAEPDLTSERRGSWLAILESDHDDLQAALSYCLDGARDPLAASRLAGALFWFWALRGHFAQGRRWAEEAVAASERSGTSFARAKVLYCAGGLAFLQGELEVARSRLTDSVTAWRASHDDHRLALALVVLGHVHLLQGESDAAVGHLVEAVELMQRLDDRWGVALARMDLGVALSECGPDDRSRARVELTQARQTWEALHDVWGLPLALTYLGRLACKESDYALAEHDFNEALEIQLREGDEWGRAATVRWLAAVAASQRHDDAAVKLYRESIEVNQKLGRKQLIAECLQGLGDLCSRAGMLEQAAVFHGSAEAVCSETGIKLDTATGPSGDSASGDRDRAQAIEEARCRGREMTLDESLRWALSAPAPDEHGAPPEPHAAEAP
jgi:predicted ATPase